MKQEAVERSASLAFSINHQTSIVYFLSYAFLILLETDFGLGIVVIELRGVSPFRISLLFSLEISTPRAEVTRMYNVDILVAGNGEISSSISYNPPLEASDTEEKEREVVMLNELRRTHDIPEALHLFCFSRLPNYQPEK